MHLFYLVQNWKFQLAILDHAHKQMRRRSFLLREFTVQLSSQEGLTAGGDNLGLVGEQAASFPLFKTKNSQM